MTETIEVEIPDPHAAMLDEMEDFSGQDVRGEITSTATPTAVLQIIEDNYKQFKQQEKAQQAQQPQVPSIPEDDE